MFMIISFFSKETRKTTTIYNNSYINLSFPDGLKEVNNNSFNPFNFSTLDFSKKNYTFIVNRNFTKKRSNFRICIFFNLYFIVRHKAQ